MKVSTKTIIWLHVALALSLVTGLHAAPAADDLEMGFRSPPESAKPWVYWWWLDGNASREGITRDLAEMKRQGIGGALVFDAGAGCGAPVGPRFMSPPWRELFQHAVAEAQRLGLGISLNICSGWDCGGTWVTPENALKKIVWNRINVQGPVAYAQALPQPEMTDNYYKDVAVLAFRLPNAGITAMEKASVRLSAGSTYQIHSIDRAVDRDTASRWISKGDKPGQGPTAAHPESITFEFAEPFAAAALFIAPYEYCGPRQCELQIAEDSQAFRTICRFEMAPKATNRVVFDEVKSRVFRLLITASFPLGAEQASPNVQISEIQLLQRGEVPQPPSANELDTRALVDITDKLDPSGRLVWQVPEGYWLIMRFGWTVHGDEKEKKTKYASPGSQGYELDFMSASALDLHFAETAAKVIGDVKALAGKTLMYFHDDSWECGEPNWTPRLPKEFKDRYGYDLAPYLPVLAGKTVGNRELSSRFMRDLRRCLADLIADNHYGRLAELSRRHGIGVHAEAGGPSFVPIMDALKNLGRLDIPMGEYWLRAKEPDGIIPYADEYAYVTCDTVKQAASAAHVYGKKLCQAEAFTNMGRNWEEDPFMLKDLGDRAFCAGLTRNMLCFYVHQPYLDIKPGYVWPSAGTHFDRNITWWNQIHAWLAYLARCQFLLQQGLFVADVCYFAGADVPCYVPAKTKMQPPLPTGFDCDTINAEVLLTRLSARDGRLVLPDGMSYRLLVLPQRQTMTPEVLDKIAGLVEAGATVVGPKPLRSPGLKDYPQADEAVRSLADRLWGACNGQTLKTNVYGKGRIILGPTLQEILLADGLQPDFEYSGKQADAKLDFIHRRLGETEIYFVSNQKNRFEEARCAFRVSGRRPELWDAVTGEIRRVAAFTQTGDGRTTLPIELPPKGSIFVVFRDPIPPEKNGSGTRNFPVFSPFMDLTGPWTVKFDPKWGGPESVEFAELVSWTKRPEDGIKHYSGKATYRKSFELPESRVKKDKRLFLDLGELKNLAEVRLNGKELGVLWTMPFRAEITGTVKNGSNHLEIAVVNLWPNRLIGDQNLPAGKRFTKTNVTKFKKDSPLLESGLFGPVRILEASTD